MIAPAATTPVTASATKSSAARTVINIAVLFSIHTSYLQKLCLPICSIIGRDHIHALVAVAGL